MGAVFTDGSHYLTSKFYLCGLFFFLFLLFGGLTFLIPYFIFVVLVGMSGVMEEFSLGRFFGAGPVGAFGGAMENGGKSKKLGEGLGAIPVIGAMGIAIGYSVVMGWIFKYTGMSLTGALYAMGQDMATIGGHILETMLGEDFFEEMEAGGLYYGKLTLGS